MYFKAHSWEDLWVDTAHNIVHKEYNHSCALGCCNIDSKDDYIAVGSVDSVHVLCFFEVG